MKSLFLCECRRFARWALALAVAHLIAVFLLGRVTSPLQWRVDDQLALIFLFMLYGFVFAIVQVGGYRRPSQWLWLIHRPVALRTIFTALFASAAALLATALLLPLLIWLVATDVFTSQVVDSRDYMAILHLLSFGLMAWLVGALTLLSRSKFVLLTLTLPVVFGAQMISVWWLCVPVSICLAWLFVIAQNAFRADRDAPIERETVLVLTALPIQVGVFLLAFHVGKASIEAAKYLRSPPHQSDVITEDEAADMPPSDLPSLLAKGLVLSSDARAGSWLEQLPLVPTASFQPVLAQFPVRHQFGNIVPSWWDEKRGIEWTFSHDSMRFEGRDPRTGAAKGGWGTQGVASGQTAASPYEQIPLDGQTRDRLYAIDIDRQRQHEVVRLPPGEWFVAAPLDALDHLFLLSNRVLRAYVPAGPDAPRSTAPTLAWEVVLPEEAARLANVDIAQLLDGWLVSLFYFDEHNRLYSPWQQIIFVDPNGATSVVAGRKGVEDVRIVTGVGGSAMFPTEAWWLSPILHGLMAHADVAFDRGLTRPPVVEWWPRDRKLWITASSLLLLSMALAYLWLRGSKASSRRRRLWLILCGILGMPAVASLIILEPRISKS
jgi:hypothetical protein